jgi:hypothetical protein
MAEALKKAPLPFFLPIPTIENKAENKITNFLPISCISLDKENILCYNN